MKKKLLLLLLCALSGAAVFLSVGLAAFYWGNVRCDVTKEQRYTLRPASAQLAQNLSKLLQFRLYASEDLSIYDGSISRYADYVKSVLQNYQAANPGRISLRQWRFAPYTAAEKAAADEGMIASPDRDSEAPLYFGLSVWQGEKQVGAIPFLRPERRGNLEDDINHILARSEREKRPLIGITSPNLPLLGAPVKNKIWSIVPKLAADYKLVEISEKSIVIPANLDLLIVQNPTFLPKLYLYALDQYLMRGGRIIMLPDPYSEVEQFYRGIPPSGKNNFAALLQSYGIVYDGSIAVGDINRAQQVALQDGGITRNVAYPLHFFAGNADFGFLSFHTPGALQIAAVDGVSYQPLVQTSGRAGTFPSSELRYMPKNKVISRFESENKSYILALSASGNFTSHYRAGALDGTEYQDKIPPFLPFSQPSAKLAVIADSDFLADDAWVYEADTQNPLYGTLAYAANAEFLLNLINQMLGQSELLLYRGQKNAAAQTLATVWFEQSAAGQAAAIESLQAKMAAAGNQAETLRQLAQQSQYGENLQYRQDLDAAQAQMAQIEREIERRRLQIKKDAAAAQNAFLWQNLLLYPLGIALALALLSWLWRWYKLRRIQKNAKII